MIFGKKKKSKPVPAPDLDAPEIAKIHLYPFVAGKFRTGLWDWERDEFWFIVFDEDRVERYRGRLEDKKLHEDTGGHSAKPVTFQSSTRYNWISHIQIYKEGKSDQDLIPAAYIGSPGFPARSNGGYVTIEWDKGPNYIFKVSYTALELERIKIGKAVDSALAVARQNLRNY